MYHCGHTHTSNDCILIKMHESYRHKKIRKHLFILGYIYIYIYERESVCLRKIRNEIERESL